MSDVRKDPRYRDWARQQACRLGWHVDLVHAAVDTFGSKALNPHGGSTLKGLDRCVSWALALWSEQYDWNQAQRLYATEVLAYAIRSAIGAPCRPAAAYAAIKRMVNHEKVHAGFKRRAAISTPTEQRKRYEGLLVGLEA